MIKVGITGCDNLIAAELVRILINHPDVELMWVTGSSLAGTPLCSIVPGLVGECDLVLSRLGDLDPVDVVFTCGHRDQLSATLDALALQDEVRVIDLSGCHNLDHGLEKPWKYGLSEMQRRILVHESRLVTVPGPGAVASLIALLPMARNLMLNNPISLHVAAGDLVLPHGDGMDTTRWAEQQQHEVTLALSQCQSSFNQPVSVQVSPLAERRALAVAARVKCGVDELAIRQLYDQYYDDHHFVFMVDRPIVAADVLNTNKCLLRIMKDEHSGELTVHAVMDALLKGSAGNAVHSMNLMFGLHERVGLALKGSGC